MEVKEMYLEITIQETVEPGKTRPCRMAALIFKATDYDMRRALARFIEYLPKEKEDETN